MAFQAIEVRGFDNGAGYKRYGVIGTFATKGEAQSAADEYTRKCIQNNSPEVYDFGKVEEVAT